MSHSENVLTVHARRPVAGKVVDGMTLGNLGAGLLVDPDMRPVACSAGPEDAVALLVGAVGPQVAPAEIGPVLRQRPHLVDVGIEALQVGEPLDGSPLSG